jgi:hypothetical protein
LFVLFITHALVGAVELGTDGWIANITGNMFTSEQGKWLLIWTSAVMFGLRFCAHFIETKMGMSPITLLMVCSILACVGLQMTSGVQTVAMAFVALTIYAIGKTFFWPTMLAVVSDRYPRTGAVAISIMGGIGMLSAGLIGGPGLGYGKDRFAAETLQTTNPAAYAEAKGGCPVEVFVLLRGQCYRRQEVVRLQGGREGQQRDSSAKGHRGGRPEGRSHDAQGRFLYPGGDGDHFPWDSALLQIHRWLPRVEDRRAGSEVLIGPIHRAVARWGKLKRAGREARFFVLEWDC